MSEKVCNKEHHLVNTTVVYNQSLIDDSVDMPLMA